uniref:Uncharacterized protein n=1 Tax=Strigamia maritima TaxID=126957 RepID=T1IW67_STRMM
MVTLYICLEYRHKHLTQTLSLTHDSARVVMSSDWSSTSCSSNLFAIKDERILTRIHTLDEYTINQRVIIAMTEGHCYWDGTSPACRGNCKLGMSTCKLDVKGDGAKCWHGKKAYCCSSRKECYK